jgi:2-oxoglutarate ferredoxin oxidoreductase subunit alpha
MELTLKIAGAAGQGLQTIGVLLSRVFFRSGYFVFVTQEYMSRVRGGHNSFQLRCSDSPVLSPSDTQDMVIALDETSVRLHREELAADGVMLADFSKIPTSSPDNTCLDIPWNKIATDEGGNKIFINIVAVGAVLGLLYFGLDCFNDLIRETIGKKKPELLEKNLQTALAGYNFAREHLSEKFSRQLPRISPRPEILATGNEAIALGTLAAGCSFYTAYPMTPATGIMVTLAHYQEQFDLMVEQAESEIAAINMVLGASFAGARAMTGTSGGGFALMAEGLSLAGMTETPAVIALAQRPGPATGLPTRTEQGDLLFALHAGHGEFPRAILTPGTAAEAFQLTFDAFNLAEKYQIPVIIMTDQFLADAYASTHTGRNFATPVPGSGKIGSGNRQRRAYRRWAYHRRSRYQSPDGG